jgi:hypothetical protein
VVVVDDQGGVRNGGAQPTGICPQRVANGDRDAGRPPRVLGGPVRVLV